MKRLAAFAAIVALAGCAARDQGGTYVASAEPVPIYKCRPIERAEAALPGIAGFDLPLRPPFAPKRMTRGRDGPVWNALAAEGVGTVFYMTPDGVQSAIHGMHRLLAIIDQHRTRIEAATEWARIGEGGSGFDASNPPDSEMVEVIDPGGPRPAVILRDCLPPPIPALDLPEPWEFIGREWAFGIMTRDGAEAAWDEIGSDTIFYVRPSEAQEFLFTWRDLLVFVHQLRVQYETLTKLAGIRGASLEDLQ